MLSRIRSNDESLTEVEFEDLDDPLPTGFVDALHALEANTHVTHLIAHGFDSETNAILIHVHIPFAKSLQKLTF